METYALALSETYTFGPTFRAENSNTTRHLAEFWMIEPEMAFYDINNDNMKLAQDFRNTSRSMLENCKDDLEFLDKKSSGRRSCQTRDQRSELGLIDRLKFVVDNDFQRLTYTEAIDILKNLIRTRRSLKYLIDQWGVDLQSEHERYPGENT